MKIPFTATPAIGQDYIELIPDIVEAILITIEDGWDQAAKNSDVNTDAEEVVITERLRDGMQASIKARKRSWHPHMMVMPGMESRSTPSVIKPDGRTDIPIVIIPIFRSSGEQGAHAIIECKRLAHTDSGLCREYVLEGVDRFVSGKYGANHTVGFMAGYLLQGTGTQACDAVNKYLEKRNRKHESLSSHQRWWLSQHPRLIVPRPIHLRHAFLGLPTASAGASTDTICSRA